MIKECNPNIWENPGNRRKKLAQPLNISHSENGMLCEGLGYTFKKKLKNWKAHDKSH